MHPAQQLIEELQINNLPHNADGSFNITAKQRDAIELLLSKEQGMSAYIQQRLKELDQDIEDAKAEKQSTTDNDVKKMMREVIKNAIVRTDELEKVQKYLNAPNSTHKT